MLRMKKEEWKLFGKLKFEKVIYKMWFEKSFFKKNRIKK